MDTEINCISSALDLPDCWDNIVEDYFQTREFLAHTEKYNPCKQRYYLLFQHGVFQSGIVMYSLKIDLLTYLKIPSPFLMNIAGIPCSVSASGIIGNPDYLPLIIGHVKSREKGLLLFLNMNSNIVDEKIISGKTLPTVIIANHFQSWEDYIGAMKASYRRRLLHLSSSFFEIRKEQVACSCFDNQMYSQYLAVLKRSKGKLETLPQEFFQHLPSNFNLMAFYHEERLIGWYISATFNDKFYFFLGGLDYSVNHRFNTYFNMLLNIVRDGIENGSAIIDLGQTAEIPKLRLGGKLVEKILGGYHSNLIMRSILKTGKNLLEYSTVVKETHVFKEIR